MQLNPLAIQFFLEKKGAALHFFHRLFDVCGWPLAKHRGECSEQMDAFILKRYNEWVGAEVN